jgi:D-amino-acid dehydrogenase
MGNYPAYQSMLNLAHSKEAHPAGIWFGFRPVSHDGLPYIGWAKQTKNLLINTGHGMLGISMGAGSGKLIAEMALGQTESLDTAVFDPKR